MRKHEKEAADAERELQKDERDRSYNSRKRDYSEVNEEEMEAYRRKRVHEDDPMRSFL